MKREIVTLCGSTKFKKQYNEANLRFTLEGKIVLSVGCYMHHDNIPIVPFQKKSLDELHFDKISMSDFIYVIDVGGYIGSSTKNEIAHAEKLGIPIRYFSIEEEQSPQKNAPLSERDSETKEENL